MRNLNNIKSSKHAILAAMIVSLIAMLPFSCQMNEDITPGSIREQPGIPQEPEDGNPPPAGRTLASVANIFAVNHIKVELTAGFEGNIAGTSTKYQDVYESLFEAKDGLRVLNVLGSNINFIDVTNDPNATADLTIANATLRGEEGGESDSNDSDATVFALATFPINNGAVGNRVRIDMEVFIAETVGQNFSFEDIRFSFEKLLKHEMYHTVGLRDDVNIGHHIMTSYQARESLNCSRNFIEFLRDCVRDQFYQDDSDALLLHYPAVRFYTQTTLEGEHVRLSWSGITQHQPTNLEIERKSHNGSFQQIAILNDINTTSYTDTNVVVGAAYTYRIKAVKGNFHQYSNETTISPEFQEPTQLSLVYRTNSSASIGWIDNSQMEEQYVIEKSLADNGTNFVEIGRVSANTVSFTDNSFGIKDDVSSYRVKAVSQGNESTYTPALIVPGTYIPEPAIGQPVRIDWHPFPGATQYKLYRRFGTHDRDGWIALSTLNGDAVTEYVDYTQVLTLVSGHPGGITNYKLEVYDGSRLLFLKQTNYVTSSPGGGNPHDF